CGAEFMRWAGKCEKCGEWNSLSQITKQPTISIGRSLNLAVALKPQIFSEVQSQNFKRLETNISEFDRVLGGGFVPGSVILLGGDPGIGKSTIALQICCILQSLGKKILYASGEESAQQVKMRAERLSHKSDNIQFLANNNIDSIVQTIEQIKPDLTIIDSIQTMQTENIQTIMGSVSQVKTCSIMLTEVAKRNNLPIILIGHVTKEGTVAGPKTLEHLVDTVLYLEGDRYHSLRVLRSIKNRFGSTNESGIFEMKENGLAEVKNPSGIFLEERLKGAEGTCVTATIEGSRSFLIEVQALVSKTNLAFPRRTASGFSLNRLQMLIAAISNKAGLRLDSQDVYVNIVGGIKTTEPAVDLAVCLSIVSALQKRPIDAETIVLGEVGLTGEVRTVPQIEKRIAEAEKLGFKKIILPRSEVKTSLQVIRVNSLRDAITKILF
ncbi:MAG: DNA repair protein RadA, partial [Patescibacteria group bacterium]|nr:DNA repair protein RadA [Patescibacteria group bacterium]